MKNFIFRYGITAGCISITLSLFNWFFIATTIGYDESQVFGYASIVISLLCIPAGIKYFKDKLNAGRVSFSEAFKIGLGITGITSTIMFFHSMLFFIFQGDEFQEWQAKGMSEVELQQLADLPAFAAAPWFQALITFLMVFILGLIINLISTLILKNAKAQAGTN